MCLLNCPLTLDELSFVLTSTIPNTLSLGTITKLSFLKNKGKSFLYIIISSWEVVSLFSPITKPVPIDTASGESCLFFQQE